MNDWIAQGPTAENLSRARRRLLVTAMYLGLAAYAGAIAFWGDRWWVLLFVVPLLGSFAIYFRFILPIAKEVNKKAPKKLDERQLAVRGRAYYRAYRIIGTLFLAVVAYAMIAAEIEVVRLPFPRTGTQFSGLILASTILYATLPASVMVWIEPDPLPDEEA